ncbi:hypothetical protein B0T16DRAFT_454839 [Cercophora newfieldiana]|uniref:Uncharacterized protein n=1 Tax=Cercophora newfieldiana TaxID=92897 RepID=A0AA40CV23_9PEZI|nr:hypothetical protein B0T16DRAFT_454839 [Cercophora newfieldiana]
MFSLLDLIGTVDEEANGWLQRRNEHGRFFNPSSPRQAWRIGEVQNITFDTKFQSYNVALWQQYANGKGADLGPVLMNLSCPSGTCASMGGFTWRVETFKFDLDVSDTFLLWMFNGTDPKSQGNTKIPNISSGYFTILEAKAPVDPQGPGTAVVADTTRTDVPATQSSNIITAGNLQSQVSGDSNSMAALVGTTVGIIAAIALLGALVWVLWRRRKRQRATKLSLDTAQPINNTTQPKRVELGESPVSEMSTSSSETKGAWAYEAPPNYVVQPEKRQTQIYELGVGTGMKPAELG